MERVDERARIAPRDGAKADTHAAIARIAKILDIILVEVIMLGVSIAVGRVSVI